MDILELLHYTFFRHAHVGKFVCQHRLRHHRYLHCDTPSGVHQRRHHSCLLRRYRAGAVCRYLPSSVGCRIFRFVCFRSRVAEQAKRYARRFRHCRLLDIRHGSRYHFSVSLHRVSPPTFRLFFLVISLPSRRQISGCWLPFRSY